MTLNGAAQWAWRPFSPPSNFVLVDFKCFLISTKALSSATLCSAFASVLWLWNDTSNFRHFKGGSDCKWLTPVFRDDAQSKVGLIRLGKSSNWVLFQDRLVIGCFLTAPRITDLPWKMTHLLDVLYLNRSIFDWAVCMAHKFAIILLKYYIDGC